MIYIVFLLINHNSVDKYINTNYIQLLIDKYLIESISDLFFITFNNVIEKLNSIFGCNINGHQITYLDINQNVNDKLFYNAISLLHKNVKNTKNQIDPFVLIEDIHKDHLLCNNKLTLQYKNGLKMLNNGNNIIFGHE